MGKIKVGLALGGGGLCGIAHIGFLQVLEENNIQIDMISGISMGAIIGGLYASGVSLKELEERAIKIDKKDILGLNAFKILKESLFSGKKIGNYLSSVLKTENIEDAKIKFYAQACDLLSGDMYTFEKGKFVDALRASSAIAGLFSPVFLNDTCYVDGGAIESVPFKVLKEKGADVVIAVNCLNDNKLDKLPSGSIATFMASYNITQNMVWRLSKIVDKKYYNLYCFDNTKGVDPISVKLENVERLIESGRKSAHRYLNRIKKLIEKKNKIN